MLDINLTTGLLLFIHDLLQRYNVVLEIVGSTLIPLVVGRGCVYEFEWRTSAACVQHSVRGEDCRVYDQQQGRIAHRFTECSEV